MFKTLSIKYNIRTLRKLLETYILTTIKARKIRERGKSNPRLGVASIALINNEMMLQTEIINVALNKCMQLENGNSAILEMYNGLLRKYEGKVPKYRILLPAGLKGIYETSFKETLYGDSCETSVFSNNDLEIFFEILIKLKDYFIRTSIHGHTVNIETDPVVKILLNKVHSIYAVMTIPYFSDLDVIVLAKEINLIYDYTPYKSTKMFLNRSYLKTLAPTTIHIK